MAAGQTLGKQAHLSAGQAVHASQHPATQQSGAAQQRPAGADTEPAAEWTTAVLPSTAGIVSLS